MRPSPPEEQQGLSALPPHPAISVPDHDLIRRIGSGSYGEVWLARSAIGACRAVKIVFRDSFDHERPFEREFNGIRKFEPVSRTHEGLVDILQIGRNLPGEYFYYVMELADNALGESATKGTSNREVFLPDFACSGDAEVARYVPKTLAWLRTTQGRLPAAECVRIGLATTAALTHLHQHGLVHRDIKPSNIIFVRGTPKLADIGTVAEIGEARSYVGTEGFIPPEGPGTIQADIYSLGKVLYELSTGKDRHDYPELPSLLENDTNRELIELNEIILKACRADPRERYQSANQVHQDFLLLQSGKSILRKRLWERRWKYTRRFGQFSISVSLCITLSWFIYQAIIPQPSLAPTQPKRIAISFRNYSPKASDTIYLDQLIAEDLQRYLKEVPGLDALNTPASVTKESALDLKQFFAGLNVPLHVQGTVEKFEDRVRLNIHLVDIRSGEQIIKETYEGATKDFFFIERQIVQSIARKLNMPVPASLNRSVVPVGTENPDAFRFYELGRNFWNQRGKGVKASLAPYQCALELDPNYALAYAGLADAYILLGAYGEIPILEQYGKAENMARKAIQLDPTLGEPRTALAMALLVSDYDWNRAEQEFLKSIELSPHYATAGQWYAIFCLSPRGRHEEALAYAQAALKLDPVSSAVNSTVGEVLLFAHRYKEAIQQLQQALLLNPASSQVIHWLGLAHFLDGEAQTALDLFDKHFQLLSIGGIETDVDRGIVLASMGKKDFARRTLDRIQNEQGPNRHPYYQALLHTALDERDHAFQALQAAFDAHDLQILWLNVDARLDRLKSDSRFETLVSKLGIGANP